MQIALEQAKAEYELVPVDTDSGEHKTAEFLALNPAGQVPTLVLPDGSILTETVAILLYLVETFPDAKLLPPTATAERIRALRWLLFMATGYYNADLRYYYPGRFTSNSEESEGIREAAEKAMVGQLEILDRMLEDQPFLAGDTRTVADAYLLMITTWFPRIDEVLNDFGNLRRVTRDAYMQPVVNRIWELNCPDCPNFQ